MAIGNKQFTLIQDDLTKAIDVDASDGRSVPINFNFIDTGYLSKDTGIELFGQETASLLHSLFHFKKKDGTSYTLAGQGTDLLKYDTGTSQFIPITSTITVTIATPAVVTLVAHGLKAGSKIKFSTTGALPTGITAGTTYFVIATGLTADAFQFSTTLGGAAVNTSGAQSGVHSMTRIYTTDAEFGFYVYDDELYGCNAVENYFKWTGTVMTEYDTAPKGNILEVFEDRMTVSGVPAEPLTLYYSKVGEPTNFNVALADGGVIKPLGTDSVTNLKNYYGALLIFKQDSIWKVTFYYDQLVSAFLPKLELQSGTYGACSRKAVAWVENDLWFYTGREVRALGFTDNVSGVFGVNPSVISEPLKETLDTIPTAKLNKVVTFYNDRRFYLGVPLGSSDTVNTVFVCHTLYRNSWTKYEGRDKANVNDFMVIDEVVYSTKTAGTFGAIKWNDSLNDINTAISCEAFFKRFEEDDFNRFRIYRYLDVMFKDLVGSATITIRSEASDISEQSDTTFAVGNTPFGEVIGEMGFSSGMFGGGIGDILTFSPFIKKRVSFLKKNQAFLIGVANNQLDETITLAQFALTGMEQPRKLFSGKRIISMD